MRAVARGLFHQSSIGSVTGVILEDGRSVVIKAHQPDRSAPVLAEVVRVQSCLAGLRSFATEVIAGPLPIGRGHAIIERFAEMKVYGASDFAVTSGGGDYTVHLVTGMDATGDLHLLDLWRRQTTPAEWIDVMCDLIRKWARLGWGLEKGQILGSVEPFMRKRMGERRAYVHLQPFPSKADKAVRAQAIRGCMSLQGLRVPTKASWYPAFLSELLQFPAGKHDDMVDCLSLIGQMLSTIRPGKLAPFIPGTHFTQTPQGPQLLKAIEVKRPTLDECWADYESRSPERTGW